MGEKNTHVLTYISCVSHKSAVFAAAWNCDDDDGLPGKHDFDHPLPFALRSQLPHY